MAQFHNIKFLKEVEGLSQRQIATKLGISRNTVRMAMVSGTTKGTDKRQLRDLYAWRRQCIQKI
jgi:DNA-directed RNA polymerase specialized sigma24 family protein